MFGYESLGGDLRVRVWVYKEYEANTLLTHPDAWQSYQTWGRFGFSEIQTRAKPKSLKPNRKNRIFKISSEFHNYLIFMSISFI